MATPRKEAQGAKRTARPPEPEPLTAAGAGRRRERHRQETRAEILQIARQIVIEHGAGRLTVREIARRAGFTPSALYRYFENGRQEILLALTLGSVEVLDGYLARLHKPASPAERLVSMGAAYLRFAREHPQEEQLLFDSVTAMEPLDLEQPDESFLAPTGVFRQLETALRDGIADGTFQIAGKDVRAVMVSIWAFVHGLVTVERLPKLHGGVSGRRVRGLIRAYINGLGTDWTGPRRSARTA